MRSATGEIVASSPMLRGAWCLAMAPSRKKGSQANGSSLNTSKLFLSLRFWGKFLFGEEQSCEEFRNVIDTSCGDFLAHGHTMEVSDTWVSSSFLWNPSVHPELRRVLGVQGA